MTMTIRDLCTVTTSCDKCSFKPACPFSVGPWGNTPSGFNNDHNNLVTNAIIETARRLEELE